MSKDTELDWSVTESDNANSGTTQVHSDRLASFPTRVVILPLPCQRHPSPQTSPICNQPIYFLAPRRQAVESASLAHLSCVSLPKQLGKTNLTLSASPCCGARLGQGVKHTHVHASSSWLCKHIMTNSTVFWAEPQSLWFWLHEMPLVKEAIFFYFLALCGIWL
jgi:hypothetical protein